MTRVEIPNEKIISKNLVNGNWNLAAGAEILIHSPYTGGVIGSTNETTIKDLQEIVDSATKAQKAWAKTPIKERCSIMFRFREILLRDADKISHLVAAENGKTFAEAKAGLMKGVEVLEFATALQNSDEGGKMEVSRGVHCEYRREPIGVVASITPFNFPAMVPMWTIPIALTLGNAYIWKPSEKTPLTATFIGEALIQAGLPAGVFSIANGGRETVEHILEHKEIKAIAFVGSSKVAKLIYSKAAHSGKRVLALGGAKNHIFLMPDANPDMSCKNIRDSFTGCAGQRCMAASVLLTVGDCNHLVDQIVKQTSELKIGDDMGAIITKEQVEFLENAITNAEKNGAKVILDGRKTIAPKGFEGGYWLGPTILDNIEANSEASKVELFGPVLSIIRCKTIDEAMLIENSNTYGNAASVFTQNGAVAEEIINRAKAGMVGINIGVPVPREPFSFGGINESKFGHGDITGPASLNFWSDLKKVTSKWSLQKDLNWMS